MSEENVEIIRSVSEPFAGIDVAGIDWGSKPMREAIGTAYSEDAELTTLESGLGTGVDGHYRGLDGFVQYLQDWLEPFGEYHVEWLDYVDAGDFVLVPSRQWGIGAASGARAELELTYLYELRDGKVVRIHQYDTLDEARAAAAKRSE
jgi:ketosteroid isomerase-like protein